MPPGMGAPCIRQRRPGSCWHRWITSGALPAGSCKGLSGAAPLRRLIIRFLLSPPLTAPVRLFPSEGHGGLRGRGNSSRAADRQKIPRPDIFPRKVHCLLPTWQAANKKTLWKGCLRILPGRLCLFCVFSGYCSNSRWMISTASSIYWERVFSTVPATKVLHLVTGISTR